VGGRGTVAITPTRGERLLNPTKSTGKQAKHDLIVGFCLAAGAGTRLRPLTDVTAKPLLAPAGRALLDLALSALGLAGAGRAVVNAHHRADQLAGWLATAGEAPEPWPATVALLREERLLGTGGGLANAVRAGLLRARVVLVTCADHVIDPDDLGRLAGPVLDGAAEAVMGLIPAAVGENLAFARSEEPSAGTATVLPARDGPWASAGVYAVAGDVLAERFGNLDRDDRGPPTDPDRPAEPSSLVEALLEPLWRDRRLAGLPLAAPLTDAGTLDRFLRTAKGLLAGRWPYRLPPGRRAGDAWVAEGATVHPRARLRGPVVVDRGATVGDGAEVEASVLGPRSEVPAGARISRSVLGPDAAIRAGAPVTGALIARGAPAPGTGRISRSRPGAVG
jgi:mannose-1-phosphate guanylyltransferase